MAKANVYLENKPKRWRRKKAAALPARRNGGRPSFTSVFDFFASPSAAELVKAQHVEPIRQKGDIPRFSDPDPKEAEWFVRQVRRWRREDRARAAKH